jgi:hypothetical protein
MKLRKISFGILSILLLVLATEQCMNKNNSSSKEFNILFLHHSTGSVIYEGSRKSIQIMGHTLVAAESDVPKWFDNYNSLKGTNYKITERNFPNEKPYGWNNYPYDYYNIWVKHAGDLPFMQEPTLEILTKKYNLIIFKHCYPVGNIIEDTDKPDMDSPVKSLENYKLQYQALKQKLLKFPDTKFIVWTGAAMAESQTNPIKSARAKEFFEWVKNVWDTDNDNIYVWDFNELETDGGLFVKEKYLVNAGDAHPNKTFAHRVAPLFCQRIVDVIENNGTKTTLTGVYK